MLEDTADTPERFAAGGVAHNLGGIAARHRLPGNFARNEFPKNVALWPGSLPTHERAEVLQATSATYFQNSARSGRALNGRGSGALGEIYTYPPRPEALQPNQLGSVLSLAFSTWLSNTHGEGDKSISFRVCAGDQLVA
jgi:hypothetical protein